MDRKLQILIALALMVAIAVLFILPTFDVMPTTMRAWRAAKMLALEMATRVLLFTLNPAACVYPIAHVPDPVLPGSEVLELTCSWLC